MALKRLLAFAFIAVASAADDACLSSLRSGAKTCTPEDACPCPDTVCFGGLCILKDDVPPPVQCGSVQCEEGVACCNASCGTCTNGACSRLFCTINPISTRKKQPVVEAKKILCSSTSDCPMVKCSQAPCPFFVCQNGACIREEIEEEIEAEVDCTDHFECENHGAQCIAGRCIDIEVGPAKDDLECESDLNCPQVRCAAGRPCPTYQCKAGRCIAHDINTPTSPPPFVKSCTNKYDCPAVRCAASSSCPDWQCINDVCIDTKSMDPDDDMTNKTLATR